MTLEWPQYFMITGHLICCLFSYQFNGTERKGKVTFTGTFLWACAELYVLYLGGFFG